jgi:hypothetical protein
LGQVLKCGWVKLVKGISTRTPLRVVHVVHFVKFHVFKILLPCCDVSYAFYVKMMFSSSQLTFILLMC